MPPLPKSKVKWLDNHFFESPYKVGLCRYETAFYEDLERLLIPKNHWPDNWINPGMGATTHYLDHQKDGALACIVCIGLNNGNNPETEEVIGLLFHEAVHIFQNICAKIGEDAPSKEFEAYMIQTIGQRLIEAYGI